MNCFEMNFSFSSISLLFEYKSLWRNLGNYADLEHYNCVKLK